MLTNGMRSNLFGDGMTALDRQSMIMDRAKTAYLKLDDITHSQTTTANAPSSFYTLVQLHRMLSDMYYDQPVDIRELYEVLTTVGVQHGIHCVYSHSHQDYVVRYLPNPQLQHPMLQQNHYQHQQHQQPTSSKAVSSPQLAQGLSSLLNSSNTAGSSHLPHPLLSRATPYSSMSPPHLSFSSIPSSLTSPSPSLSPQPHPQQQQQPQAQQYPFSGTAPMFGALS